MDQPSAGFLTELRALINRYSQENISNTPDFILAAFIRGSLDAFNDAVVRRDNWWGNKPEFQKQT